MTIPTLDTSRLRVRPLVEADLDAVVGLLDACFGPAPRAERASWLDWTIRGYRELTALRQPPYGDRAVALREGGTVVGAIGLVPSLGPFGKLPSFGGPAARVATDHGRPTPAGAVGFTPEVGLFWAVAPEHRGRGYAAEAAAALAAYAFEALRFDRLVATTEHANASSIGVMRRLGMTVERNPDAEPHWFQSIGVLRRPTL